MASSMKYLGQLLFGALMVRNALALVMLLLASMPLAAQSAVYVRDYKRTDGTYVPGHYRTRPNNSTFDNYSTRGNYNPYTGREGTRAPYAPPSYGGSATRRSLSGYESSYSTPSFESSRASNPYSYSPKQSSAYSSPYAMPRSTTPYGNIYSAPR